MNSPIRLATTSEPAGSTLRRALPATAAVWGTMLLLGPVAYWRYEAAGVGIVTAIAGLVTLTAWLGIWLERSLAKGVAGQQSVAGLLAPSGVRMMVPLAFSLVIVVGGRGYVSPQIVLFVVPLYLAMLTVETLTAVRHLRGSQRRATDSTGLFDSAPVKQG